MSSRIDAFLARMESRRGNLIFALDATASRRPTWDAASKLTAQMFKEVATIGTLSMQLGYFRGTRGFSGECAFSKWKEDPMALAVLMSKIDCRAGETQIELVLKHAANAAAQRKINAMIYIGDCCEEKLDVLISNATRLAELKVPTFMFHEGSDVEAQIAFKEVARITGGAYFRFDQNCLAQLAATLNAIATFAVGGVDALPPAARLLIGQS